MVLLLPLVVGGGAAAANRPLNVGMGVGVRWQQELRPMEAAPWKWRGRDGAKDEKQQVLSAARGGLVYVWVV